MLSTLKVKSAKPEARAYKLADSGGLYLLVQPNGSRLWRYKFRVCGTEGLQALGAFPEIGLAEVRGLHTDARKLVLQGINPIQARRDEKIVQAQTNWSASMAYSPPSWRIGTRQRRWTCGHPR